MRSWLGGSAAALFFVLAIFACKKDSATTAGSSGPEVDSGGESSGSSGASSGSSGDDPDGGNASSGSSGQPPPPKYTVETKETMQFEGTTRECVLGKPKDYDAKKKYPVVMSFHGDGGTGPLQAQFTPFETVSQSEAILVYPTGLNTTWTLYAADNPDIRWIKALIDEVGKKLSIDKTKVFGWGYSNGAYFLAQMTCREGNVFKAISSNAGGGPNDDQGELEDVLGIGKRPSTCLDCPGGAIPALVIHGSGDDPGGGEFTARCIAETSACQNKRSASTPTPCEQYDGCPATNPVKWCEIPGLPHAVWSQSMAESWKFFKAL